LGIKHLSFHRASGLFRVRIIGQPVKYFKTKSAGYAHIVSKRITK
jgi:hypothetical protein